MTVDNKHIEELLPLYFEGKLTEEERLRVERWMGENPKNRTVAQDMSSVFRDMDALFVMQHVDDVLALNRVDKKIRGSRILLLMRKVERVAAILLLPVIMLCVWQYIRYGHEEVRELSFTASPGMTAKAQLPDGTVVVLNSNSTLTYPSQFKGTQREVKLSGEAYFSVTKDAEHPFVVKTPYQANVKVYGTKFNVEAYPKDNLLTATLEEGRISLNYMDGKGNMEEKFIFPGQSVCYKNYGQPKLNTEAYVDAAKSWIEGKMIFRDTPAKDVLRQLEKCYHVKFVVHNAKVYENRFTGTMEEQHLDRVLNMLSQTSNMRFKQRKTTNLHKNMQVFDIY